MKEWTKHEARSDQLIEAEQFNAEQTSFRGQAAALDRTQYPADVVTEARLTDHATHIVVVHDLWAATGGITDSEGEQTNVRASAADSSGDQFRAITYQLYGGGWRTAFNYTVEPFKGGSLQTEWFGNIACFQFFYRQRQAGQQRQPVYEQAHHAVECRNADFAQRCGGGGAATACGQAPWTTSALLARLRLQSGPVEVQCQWRLTGPGPDDAVTESRAVGQRATLTLSIMTQGHLF